MGTIHYPQDYLYYLSQIAQGEDHIFLSSLLWGTQPFPKIAVYWPYVFFGRIGSILRISPIYMYQVALTVCGLLFCVSVYALIKRIFPNQWQKRVLTFLLFMFSNTFLRIVVENGQTILAPYYSWYNYGEPFLRFSAVPTHLLIQSAIFLIIISFLSFPEAKQKTKYIYLVFAAFAGTLLGSLQPVQWILMAGSLGVFSLLRDFKRLKQYVLHPSILQLQTLIYRQLPLLLLIFIGSPLVLYLSVILRREPFISASLWEASQSPYIFFNQIFQYWGPEFVISFLGIPLLLRQKKIAINVIVWISGISLFIFFHPYTKTLPVLTFRYLSSLPVLLYAAGTSEVIDVVPRIFGKFAPVFRSMIITALFFMLLPLFHKQLTEKLAFDTYNPKVYISKEVYTTFLEAKKRSQPTDGFLVEAPYEWVFPAIANRPSVAGEFYRPGISPIEDEIVSQHIATFFYNLMTESEMKIFLQTNNVQFVIARPATFPVSPSILTPIYQNNSLILYKVKT